MSSSNRVLHKDDRFVVFCLLGGAIAVSSFIAGYLVSSYCDDTTEPRRCTNKPEDRAKGGEIRGQESHDDSKVKRSDAPRQQRTENSTSTTQYSNRCTLEEEMAKNGGTLTVRPIGVVRSIYRLCVGTPRQGLLAPNARGRIELTIPDAADAVDALEGYSHIWIFFIFHLNTTSLNQKSTSFGNKIAPPALGGRKVGVLATRSPHRFNPIGVSLCKLDHIEYRRQQSAPVIWETSSNHAAGGNQNKSKKKKRTSVCLHVSGLDLVSGTPVIDIKPYVPIYDAPPSLKATNTSVDDMLIDLNCTVPEWVSGGLATKRNVVVTDAALDELQSLVFDTDDFSLEFYGANVPNRSSDTELLNGNSKESREEGYARILDCIKEVLQIDVRSQFQTTKARRGKFQAERAKRMQLSRNESSSSTTADSTSMSPNTQASRETECTQQLDNLLLYYTITPCSAALRETSIGSGAEDRVTVTSIKRLDSRS